MTVDPDHTVVPWYMWDGAEDIPYCRTCDKEVELIDERHGDMIVERWVHLP